MDSVKRFDSLSGGKVLYKNSDKGSNFFFSFLAFIPLFDRQIDREQERDGNGGLGLPVPLTISDGRIYATCVLF